MPQVEEENGLKVTGGTVVRGESKQVFVAGI